MSYNKNPAERAGNLSDTLVTIIGQLASGPYQQVDPERIREQLRGVASNLEIEVARQKLTREHAGDHAALASKGWALTYYGWHQLQEHQPAVSSQPTGKSLTVQWVEQQGPMLIDRLRSYLRGKMPRSAAMSKLDDHVQQFLMNMIRRNALASRISNGEKIPISHVCGWCLRSAYSDIRNEGREPVTRTLHGALTPNEWVEWNTTQANWTTEVMPWSVNSSDKLLLGSSHHNRGDEDSVDAMDFLVSEDQPDQRVEDHDAYQATIKAIRTALEDAFEGKPYDLEQHLQIMYDKFVLRLTSPEIGEKYSLEQDAVHAHVLRIRRAVRRAHTHGAFNFMTE